MGEFTNRLEKDRRLHWKHVASASRLDGDGGHQRRLRQDQDAPASSSAASRVAPRTVARTAVGMEGALNGLARGLRDAWRAAAGRARAASIGVVVVALGGCTTIERMNVQTIAIDCNVTRGSEQAGRGEANANVLSQSGQGGGVFSGALESVIVCRDKTIEAKVEGEIPEETP